MDDQKQDLKGKPMPKILPLAARLEALNEQIVDAQRRQNLKGILSKEHKATGDELAARYALLKSQLDEEVASEEAHSHHVGNLERAARAWLDSLDFND